MGRVSPHQVLGIASTWCAGMIFWLAACSQSESTHNSHLSDVVNVFEMVAVAPENTIEMCQDLPTQYREQCLLLGAEHLQRKNPDKVEDICPLLNAETKGECWFHLAERTNSIGHCTLATPYEKDCQLHLLSRQLFRSKSDDWNTMLDTAKSYNVDPSSVEGKTVLFRHLLSNSDTIDTSRCNKTSDSMACILAAKSLYRDRLRYAEHQKTFPCTSDIPLDMQHLDAPELTDIFDEFFKVLCVN